MQRVARDCQRQLSYLLTQTAQKGAWSNVACIISLSNAALHNLSLRQICFCLCLSVCPSVCVFVTRVYCAKTAEQIEMMFGGGLTLVDPKNHILDGVLDRTNPFAAERGHKSAMRPFTKLLWTLVG